MRGLKLPIQVSPTGGIATTDGEDNDWKIIATALSADDNDNAFQQGIGMGDAIVFEDDDPANRGKVMYRLRQVFRRFEVQKRFRLLENTIRWKTDEDTGVLELHFEYHDLETDERRNFSKTLTTNTNQRG